MTRSEAYNGIYDVEPNAETHKVFFAFSEERFYEGMKRCGYKDTSEIVHAGRGIYGSKEALQSYFGEYEKRAERVAKECDPQKVYDHEFINYECDYVGDDEEAILIIVERFGKDKALQVQRRRAKVQI